MIFTPQPDNDFQRFIDTYFDRCRRGCPKLLAIAGKWRFEDLIPGLSDFDTRFIFADDTTVSDWIAMSIAVGQVHATLAREVPPWARILEHLPGINLTWDEMLDPTFYYPEFQQWTYYQGDTAVLQSISDRLARTAWSRRDERFHLKRFATYVGPYQRGIDPPVNLGPWESKYPLHSRFMHYFTPPVQAAVSLLSGRGICGKLEALRLARRMFPHPDVIDTLLDALDRHYEIPEAYIEPRLTEIETALDAYLREVYARLDGHVTLITVAPDDTPATIRAKVAAVPADPVQQFYEGAKFCRFMKGRLLFYATDIAWFDTTWLIRNELGRIVSGFFDKPLRAYGRARFGQDFAADVVLERLRGNLLPPDACDGARRFAQVASQPIPPGEEKLRARAVADVFEPLQVMVEALAQDLKHARRDDDTAATAGHQPGPDAVSASQP